MAAGSTRRRARRQAGFQLLDDQLQLHDAGIVLLASAGRTGCAQRAICSLSFSISSRATSASARCDLQLRQALRDLGVALDEQALQRSMSSGS